jgi:hypothetical protein
MWRILDIGKVTISNFKVWVSENHWNIEMKPGPLVSLSSRLNHLHPVTGRLPTCTCRPYPLPPMGCHRSQSIFSSSRSFAARLCSFAVALLLRHSEKLPPSSLRQWASQSRNLPQTVDHREELPEASRGRPPSASAAPRCGQRTSDSEPVCRCNTPCYENPN